MYYGVCIPQELILDNDDNIIQTVFTDKLDAFKVFFYFWEFRFFKNNSNIIKFLKPFTKSFLTLYGACRVRATSNG